MPNAEPDEDQATVPQRAPKPPRKAVKKRATDTHQKEVNRVIQILSLLVLFGLYVLSSYGPRPLDVPWWLVLLLISLAGAEVPDLLLRYLGSVKLVREERAVEEDE